MDRDGALKTLMKGAGVTFIGILVSNVVGYLYKLVTARYLGPEGYGVISQGLMIFSITATLALLGLPAGVQRFVSKYKAENREKLEKGVIISALEIGLTTSIIACIILFIGAEWMAVQFFNDENVAIAIKVLAFAVPMRAVMAVSLKTASAYKKIEYKVYSRNLTEGLVKILFTALLLWMGLDVFGATLAVLLGWTAAAGVALYLTHTRIMAFLTDGKPFERPYRELVEFSSPLIFSGVFGQITSWADVFLVGFFMSSAAVGLYNTALPTAMILGMASSAIGALAVPVLTEMYSRENFEELEKVYKTGSKWIFMTAFPGALLMALFADQGLSFLFGTDFTSESAGLGFIQLSETGLSLALLALGYLMFSLSDMSRQLVQASGDTKYNLYISIIVGATNLGFNFVLIPVLGIVGAALATATSWILGGFFSMFFVYREMKIHPFKKTFLSVMAASLISALTPYLIANAVFDTVPKLVIFPAGAMFGIVYVTLFLLFGGLEEDDAMILKTAEEKIGIEIPYMEELIERF